MQKLPCLLFACLLLAACRPGEPEVVANKSKTIEIANPEEGGAVSTAPVEKTPPSKRPHRTRAC